MHKSTVRFIALAAGAIACATACADPISGVAQDDPPSPEQVTELFDTWNDTLASGDPEAVADLYAPDAVLLPTVSNVVRTDRAGIVDYFTGFLPTKPSAVIEQSTVNVLDSDNAIDTGVYRITLSKSGVPEVIDARYTFVYEKRDGEWLIVNHHSSEMPESES
ncbi:SgcJ/EcaC family oxidoreductase [Rhodococcus sp. NPDC058514]|uniref:SgcJ/EcaC family oxidoreductase n=1 Tax=unclassified Rhodococcus (in: high G+C Gram-positive bacteria) TaxID=192944 RepID=UPI003663CF06